MIKENAEASMHFSRGEVESEKGYIWTLGRSIATSGPDSPAPARSCRVTHA